MIAIYCVVVLIAAAIGAMTGLGSGVMVKPVFDFLKFHDVANISFLSSCAVLTMALYSVMKQVKSKESIDFNIIIYISIGSAFGGFIGIRFFDYLIQLLGSALVLKAQSCALIAMLILVIVSMVVEVKHYQITSPAMIIFIGILLGIISSFVGIGGGPLNVAIFNILFSVDFKKATIYSVATILFSQIATLLTIGFTNGFGSYDVNLLWYILPCALLGSIIGTFWNKIATDKLLKLSFNVVMLLLVILNVYNVLA